MTTTTDTTTPVRSHQSMTMIVGDDAAINVVRLTTYPQLGSYQLRVNGSVVYLTEESARALVRRLTQAMDAARDGAE